MISFVKGRLVETGTDHIVVENQGIGYLIFVPASVLDQMPASGSEVKIYTYLYVREDALCLYGFLTRDDLHVFKLLITVNGIGPKGALGILSTISPDNLRFAVLAGDTKTISKAPGIGSKTAQKLIIELKDKLKLEDVFGEDDPVIQAVPQGAKSSSNEACTCHGWLWDILAEALKAVRQCEIREDMTSDEILKLALKNVLTL